jgi:hypothetical protein
VTLTDQTIERLAIDLYKDSLKRPGYSEDICADIYLAFIARMKSLRSRHPEPDNCKVNDAFIRQCRKLTIKDIMRSQSKQERQDEVLEQVCMHMNGENDRDRGLYEESDVYGQILSYIRETTQTKESFKKYAFMFILYYASYLDPEFTEKAADILGMSRPLMEWYVNTIRDITHRSLGERKRKGEDSASACYVRMIRQRMEMRDTEPGITNREAEEYYCRLRRLQFTALEGLRRTEPVARLSDIAKLCRMHPDTVRYGVRVFCLGFRAYLGSTDGNDGYGSERVDEAA